MIASLFGFLSCLTLAASTVPTILPDPHLNQTDGLQKAPLYSRSNACDGRYIVIFKENHTLELHQNFLGYSIDKLHHIWDDSPSGYSADLNETSLESIRMNTMVAFVEQDYFLEITPWEVYRDNASLEDHAPKESPDAG